ncbi:PQQ-dependent sugar dehydrogenase [Engelhardtia mirabilis]|uniref:Glucose/Sorbosone dehydrogenase domain-containing protein n=1 Tax=Engelhardtia mirabilis TaxID=2528011 RepID=A0A518BEI8_9BACT|nr:hypothetical protein Pla133_04410 [Planctomycetes bacterium Pla133]QDU99702.1 hypothetical protein Pla86_04410 [Planctomycetes bacterium Pla86]
MLAALLLCAQLNQPPWAPAINEPPVIGPAVNPGDVPMESVFADPDAGDAHLASDWELWTVVPFALAWTYTGAAGFAATNAALGDGSFVGSHAGAGTLFDDTTYLLRVRHRDDSGDPATEWSPWASRAFTTGSAQDWFPLELKDVLDAPGHQWTRAADGAAVDLPGGAVPPSLALEASLTLGLLTVTGSGGPDLVSNPPPLPAAGPVRARLNGGANGLVLPETDLELHAPGCEKHVLLLPAVNLQPFEQAIFWFSDDGVSFEATAFQTAPVFIQPARLPEPPWIVEQSGFVVEEVATGLALPVDIAFVPAPGPAPDDVLFYVSELYGTIRTVTRDGSVGTYAANLLNYDPGGLFPGSGEQGVTGLAVDPITGDVFASMLYDTGLGTPWNPVHYPKVVRFTSLDGGRTAASQQAILDFVGEVQGQSHQISNLTIADDGRLFVHMGDGFASATAMDLSSFRGKLLRAELDGSPAADNPYFDAGDGIDARDYVWASGVRNPFGGDLRFADGNLYVVENGPWQDRLARITPGLDLGWDGNGTSMAINALWNWFPARAPVDMAFAQATTFGGGGFPPAKWDRAFVSLSGPTYLKGPQDGAKRIDEFLLNGVGAVVGEPVTLVSYAGMGHGSIAGLAFGPDGLYFSTLYPEATAAGPTGVGASILRVRYEGVVDCNGNGQADDCDIALGSSADCNGDGVPDECQVGLAVVRSGEPANPAALAVGSTGPPVIGGVWRPLVDNALVLQGAVTDVLALTAKGLNVPTPFGTLLCDLSGATLSFITAPGVPFAVTVPSDCALIGVGLSAQAVAVGALGELALTNALDLTIGS